MITTLVVILIVILALVILAPTAFFLYMYTISKQPQHSIIRAHPYLGWLRYLLEKMGPEFRQYWFNSDTEGRPFPRTDFLGVVFGAKYQTDIISFGGQRDFEKPGFYLSNDLFPKLMEEMRVDNHPLVKAHVYEISKESLFTRHEHLKPEDSERWLYDEQDTLIVGPERRHPWPVRGMFGASATSYGAVGEHYIQATGNGSRMAGGSWINTGEGGVAPDHLATGADIVSQIGPGLFGFRDDQGNFSIEEFKKKAAEENIRAFELKFHQGAKIRGGHLEGAKVNEKIANIRKVPAGQTVNSPNRFTFLKTPEDTLKFVQRLQNEGGKPVGIKLVVGDNTKLDAFFQAMLDLHIVPDFITVDGSEGGSGATYKSMADGMGLPLFSALLILDDTARKYGLRDRLKIFASGKLITPDKVALALALGADLVNSARGFMIANGCIMAQQCQTGKCPTGITTTDPKYQRAHVPEEKQWRVLNYILQIRHGVFALSAACGVESPRKLGREHAVFTNEHGRSVRVIDLFPYPRPEKKPKTARQEELG